MDQITQEVEQNPLSCSKDKEFGKEGKLQGANEE
jgi:hypothetical protein